MRLTIIGGDARNRYLAKLAASRGHQVQLVGHGETLRAANPCGLVVMPFPVAEADGYAPTPPSAERLKMESVLPLILPGARVYATKPGPVLTQYMQKHGCTRIDFMESEAFALRNAIPSAEGAIHALMARASVCIDQSECLIVGYGRIGRALALRLRGLGARVTVAARSEAARAMAEGDGCRAIPLCAMASQGHCRFLLNTVPERVVGDEVFTALAPEALAVDLASPPYGFDPDAAMAHGVTAWREPGLPGRYAPETAAAAMLALIEEKDGA